jgi:alpha-tubulin suppressor-like RCC1 family protein
MRSSHKAGHRLRALLGIWLALISASCGDEISGTHEDGEMATALVTCGAPGGGGTCSLSVDAGGSHACAQRTDHSLFCWGSNTFGQLGIGNTTNHSSPVQVRALGTGVTSVSAGNLHTCAKKSDGTVWCWGANSYGQLGDGGTTTRSSPVRVTGLPTTAVEVSAGHSHTCARTTDGKVWCWGSDFFGQLGNGVSGSGHDSSRPLQVTSLGSTVVGVSAGGNFTCAVKTNGSLYCWGRDIEGQLGNGRSGPFLHYSTPQLVSGISSVAGVSTGDLHACARKTDNSVWCWGYNGYGEVGNGTTTIQTVPAKITTSATNVSAGGYHTCARTGTSTALCWGRNSNKQIGDGSTTNRLVPIKVTALGSSVASVSAGQFFTCARRTNNSLVCWGDNTSGQLGNGTTSAQSCPVAVSMLCPLNGSSLTAVRPGATLFLVWQQNRSSEADGVGDFDFGRDFRSLRTAPGDNVLAMKMNYWLGL